MSRVPKHVKWKLSGNTDFQFPHWHTHTERHSGKAPWSDSKVHLCVRPGPRGHHRRILECEGGMKKWSDEAGLSRGRNANSVGGETRARERETV